MDKVSVIVPVYNTIKYLKQCVNSILNQDYCNLELILVDDGSTDGSGDVCDDFKKEFPSIIVIHQENQGLSAARNTGTKAATGYYIAYIDSDDWVTPNYISYQINLAKKYNADIVVTRQQSVWDGATPQSVDYSIEEITLYTKTEALETILYGYKMQMSACKLFKANIVRKYPFPVGALYEDLGMMYKVFSDAEIVVHSNLPMYNYRRRAGSIINDKFDKRRLVIIKHSNEQYEFIKKNYPQLIRASSYRCAYSATEIAPMIIAANDDEALTIIRAELMKHYRDLIYNPKASLKIKIRGLALILGKRVAKIEIWAEKIYKIRMKKELFG